MILNNNSLTIRHLIGRNKWKRLKNRLKSENAYYLRTEKFGDSTHYPLNLQERTLKPVLHEQDSVYIDIRSVGFDKFRC